MHTILTGMNGTVAPALAHVLSTLGHTVTGWDRQRVPVEDPQAGADFIDAEQPDFVAHIATGSPDWMEATAQHCRDRNIPFLFTSSVSVFDGGQSGPFSPDHPLDAQDDYGKYKAECEQRVTAANPDTIIVRLGWQIGTGPGNNNMIDHLTKQHAEQGAIQASTGWIPSTAFLSDTATALYHIMHHHPVHLYQLEGNPCGLTFHEIVRALNRLHGRPWKIHPKEESRRDNRMLDSPPFMPAIETHFQ